MMGVHGGTVLWDDGEPNLWEYLEPSRHRTSEQNDLHRRYKAGDAVALRWCVCWTCKDNREEADD